MTASSLRFVLASASPRRRELLEGLGVAFEIRAADIDERVRENEKPIEYARRLASEKAERVSEAEPGAVVLGADTIVVLSNGGAEQILGKPSDKNDAFAMLRLLSNREHHVYTAYSIRSAEIRKDNIVKTAVVFQPMSDDEIHRYVETGEPSDKAGAYAIQGIGGMFVKRIHGSYSNVVGLPVAELYEDLKALELVSKLAIKSRSQ